MTGGEIEMILPRPRNAGSLLKLGEAREGFSPRVFTSSAILLPP